MDDAELGRGMMHLIDDLRTILRRAHAVVSADSAVEGEDRKAAVESAIETLEEGNAAVPPELRAQLESLTEDLTGVDLSRKLLDACSGTFPTMLRLAWSKSRSCPTGVS